MMDINWTMPFAAVGFLVVAFMISMCLRGDGPDYCKSASIKTQCARCKNVLNVASKFCGRCGAKA